MLWIITIIDLNQTGSLVADVWKEGKDVDLPWVSNHQHSGIFKTILTNEMIIITFIIATFIVKRIISIICLDKNIKVIRINMIFISPLALSCFNIASITMYVPVRPTWWWRWWQWKLIIMIAMLTMMKNDNWSLRWCRWWNWPRHCNGRPGALQTPARLRTISWWTTEPGFRIINAWSWWSAPVLLWSIWYHIQQHIAGNR